MGRYDEKKPRLEHYSQQFAKRLFARHPEWKPYAGYYAKGEPGLLSYYLQVEIPSANPNVQTPLVIRTNSSPEVLVSWMDGWHFHVSPWPKQSREEHYAEALDKIDEIVSDEYLVGVYYKDGKSTGGFGVAVGADIRHWIAPERGRWVIRSWRGAHDRESIE